MRVLLDTNAYTAFRRGNKSVVDHIRQAEDVLLSAIVVGELLFGYRNGSRYEENARDLQAFLADASVHFLPVSWKTADLFGEIAASLRKAGTPIPTSDIWIAAQAKEADASLLSADRHFLQVDGIDLIKFTIA